MFEIRADPGGLVYLHLKSLENLENKNYMGRCCAGGTLGPCTELCNYQLEIWVNCDAKKSDSTCSYGYSKTRTFNNTNNINFGNSLGNTVQNPSVYNFSVFQVRCFQDNMPSWGLQT